MSEAPTVSGTVDLIAAPSRLIEGGIAEFGKVLPASVNPEKFARWGLSVLKNGLRSEKSGKAWATVLHPDNEAGRLSVMESLMDCASLGLEPGRTYHMVPFNGVVQGITDYKGEIQLIHNARPATYVVAVLRHRDDDFEWRGYWTRPGHDGDPFAERGPVTGGYAFTMTDGHVSSMIIAMSEADFLKHREKAKTKAVWDEWPEPMRVKTLVHQVRKVVPWSAERQW